MDLRGRRQDEQQGARSQDDEQRARSQDDDQGARSQDDEQGARKEGNEQAARSQDDEQEARSQDDEQGARSQEHSSLPMLLRRRQKVILNGQSSKWHDVTASIIQGSVLGPTLAKCFSNTSHQGRNLLPEDKPLVSKFADDEKRCRIVKNEEQGQRMQAYINKMVGWTFKMGVELNEEKIHLLHIGRNNPNRGPRGRRSKNVPVEQEKDLGVIISSDLKSDKMVAIQCQKGHLKLTQFNNAFTYRGRTWLKLYKTYVKPSLL